MSTQRLKKLSIWPIVFDITDSQRIKSFFKYLLILEHLAKLFISLLTELKCVSGTRKPCAFATSTLLLYLLYSFNIMIKWAYLLGLDWINGFQNQTATCWALTIHRVGQNAAVELLSCFIGRQQPPNTCKKLAVLGGRGRELREQREKKAASSVHSSRTYSYLVRLCQLWIFAPKSSN